MQIFALVSLETIVVSFVPMETMERESQSCLFYNNLSVLFIYQFFFFK